MIFVTGLPRSRTGWFSLYLGVPHELLNGCHSKKEFYALAEAYGGTSDCALAVTDFQEHWPDAKTVVIHREPKDVYNSLQRLGHAMHLGMLESLAEKLKDLKGLHVRFEDVNHSLEAVCAYLGVGFDPMKAERFKRMSVEPMEIHGDPKSMEVWQWGG